MGFMGIGVQSLGLASRGLVLGEGRGYVPNRSAPDLHEAHASASAGFLGKSFYRLESFRSSWFRA